MKKPTTRTRVRSWPQIRIRPETYQYLKLLADSQDISLNSYANNLLTMIVNRLKETDK